jgi:hypothetical protein
MANSIYELITAFTAGLFLLYLLTFFLRLKRKSVLILALNSLAGTAVYAAAGLIRGFPPGAALHMFLCGLSGSAGVMAILIISII